MVKNRLPPGPHGLPVVGYLPFLGFYLHERFTEMAKNYGPIFSLQLGCKLHVVVNSVDLIKVVARERDHTFANRAPPITALEANYGGVDVVWSNNNAHWRNMQKLLVNQVLSSTNLTACQSYRTHEVRKMVNQVYNKIGKKIDINEIAFKTKVNVVTSMLWGRSKSSEMMDYSRFEDEFREVEFKFMVLLAAPNISDFLPMLSWFDLQGLKREMKKQFEYLDRILDTIIKERIEETSSKIKGIDVIEEDGKKDFLRICLELKDRKDCPKSFSMDHIKALLLVKHRDCSNRHDINDGRMGVMKKVQDELTEVISMKLVEESDVPKLTYLDAVVKETFRLHPPLPLLMQRCPDEDCIMAGYTIPKGTNDFNSAMRSAPVHRDPKNWPNPLEFSPERYLNSKWDYTGSKFQFLPFWSGRRICPGILLGEKMLMYILASLLHSFEWHLPKDEELELFDVFGIVTKKKTHRWPYLQKDYPMQVSTFFGTEICGYMAVGPNRYDINDGRMGVMKKVQDELTEVIGMKLVEESDRPKLTYLDAVVKETFRLHPPLPLLMQRCPDEDCIMTGYTIPKGTIVYMNVWAVHRDPKNWPNPLEFSPERFLNSKWDYTGSKFQFLPFWSGRRICPGILLGEKMLMYILASLLHSFEWHLPKDKELELSDVFGIVTKKKTH
ncbi:cytochrome P450 76C1-like protein [Tanacetum coccineum]